MNRTSELINYNFSKVAYSYLDNAMIQKSSALRIIDKIPEYYQGGLILDLGSGPGTLAYDKLRHYPAIEFDLSLAMLKTSETKFRVNGDATQLPFMANSFPLIISNLMLQWTENKLAVIKEAYRVLQHDGYLILASLVEPSLEQLRQAWKCCDDKAHTLVFPTSSDYVRLFEQGKFTKIKVMQRQQTYYFENVAKLLQHFKQTGTSLVKSTSNNGLGGRKQLAMLENAYQKLATNKGLPLSYTYILIIAKKGD